MDHREIGRRLDLFMQHELAPGCPIWLPNGTILYNLLADRIRKYNAQHGYHEVRTPVLWNHELYKLSGHWDHYQDFMFGVHGREEDKLYSLKPMNCPGHMLIYKSKQWSYQDLPYRLHDQGVLHRDETSGAIGGLTRCRGFCQDDGHVFLRPDQIMDEVRDMVKMVDNIYTNQFEMRDLRMVLSTRPDKFMGDSGEWDHAEAQLKLALRDHNFTIENGGGAFYGPKVDFFVKDSQAKEWQTATIQLDFQLPQRFQLEYTDQDGVRKTPVVIHRAYYGSFERFIAIVLEHYQEKLPFWLCPVQAIFLPITDRHIDYCRVMQKHFAGVLPVRTEVDESNNRISAKVLHATERMIPYMLVVGDTEVTNDTLNVRHLYDKTWEGEKSWRLVVDRFFALEKPSF
jgi:threonyl-tRNA synthetase